MQHEWAEHVRLRNDWILPPPLPYVCGHNYKACNAQNMATTLWMPVFEIAETRWDPTDMPLLGTHNTQTHTERKRERKIQSIWNYGIKVELLIKLNWIW